MATLVSDDNLLAVTDKMMDICAQRKFKIFDGFFPLVPELFDDDDEDYGIFFDAMPTDLENNVNISVFKFGDDDGSKWRKKAQAYRLRAISRKELRKRTGVFAMNPYCLEIGFEKYDKIADGFYTISSGAIKHIDIPGYKYISTGEDETTIRCCLGCQFNLENQNYVYLRPEESEIGFKLPIDNLQQVKELFAMRDIPDGYKRRAALRHWVSKHMRRKPSTPDEKVEVKRHLRGKTDFSWYGMSGTIYVNV